MTSRLRTLVVVTNSLLTAGVLTTMPQTSAWAAAAFACLVGTVTWATHGLVRWTTLILMAPRDHWRTTPLNRFFLLGMLPTISAGITGFLTLAVIIGMLAAESGT